MNFKPVFLGLRRFSNVNVLHKGLLLQDWGLQEISEIEISFIIMFPIMVVNFINGLAQELNPFTNRTGN